jgi:hypothetical protein
MAGVCAEAIDNIARSENRVGIFTWVRMVQIIWDVGCANPSRWYARAMPPALSDEDLLDSGEVFCKRIGFTIAQSETVFEKASELGLPVKMPPSNSPIAGEGSVPPVTTLSPPITSKHLDEGGALASRRVLFPPRHHTAPG